LKVNSASIKINGQAIGLPVFNVLKVEKICGRAANFEFSTPP